MKNVAILLSGRGSNFLALSDAIESGQIAARVVAVVSNRGDAAGLERAGERGYSSYCIPSAGKSRAEFDLELTRVLKDKGAEVVCLAGFMRMLSAEFVAQFPSSVLNIHPSLLPAFPGLDAQRQALEWGARVSGCTVHFVDEKLDHGPIILQRTVEIRDNDTVESLSERILREEHKAYPEALRLFCEDRLRIEGRTVRILQESEIR